MSRRMYDSVDANAIPTNAQMVAGYIDGTQYKWTAANWARFPTAVKVRIARRTFTNDGHVLDVESGIPTVWPLDNPSVRAGIRNWVRMRRAAGVEPTIYCNQLFDWPVIRQIFHEAGMREPYYWVARYNNVPDIPAEAIAKQYANPPLAGGHYDLSIVADYWPGVDTEQESMAKQLVLVQDNTGKVWVSDHIWRRHVSDPTELSGLQWWIQERGGNDEVSVVDDIRVFGKDVDLPITVNVNVTDLIPELVAQLPDLRFEPRGGGE